MLQRRGVGRKDLAFLQVDYQANQVQGFGDVEEVWLETRLKLTSPLQLLSPRQGGWTWHQADSSLAALNHADVRGPHLWMPEETPGSDKWARCRNFHAIPQPRSPGQKRGTLTLTLQPRPRGDLLWGAQTMQPPADRWENDPSFALNTMSSRTTQSFVTALFNAHNSLPIYPNFLSLGTLNSCVSHAGNHHSRAPNLADRRLITLVSLFGAEEEEKTC